MAKGKKTIPPEVKAEIQTIIAEFNRKKFGNEALGYSARLRGKYLYLDRNEYGRPSPICRLSWNGEMDNWDFAIYKYSNNGYDPDEWFFPGQQHVDGTIIGAMKAGLEAYQP